MELGIKGLCSLLAPWDITLPLNTCRDDGRPAAEVKLEDNGLGADRVEGDGLYAKYFIDFTSSSVMLSNSPVHLMDCNT